MSKQFEVTAKDQQKAQAKGHLNLKHGVVLMSREWAQSQKENTKCSLVEMPDFASAPFWISCCGIAGAKPMEQLDGDMIESWQID